MLAGKTTAPHFNFKVRCNKATVLLGSKADVLYIIVGTTSVYVIFFKPDIYQHDNEIHWDLLQLIARAIDMVIIYFQKAASIDWLFLNFKIPLRVGHKKMLSASAQSNLKIILTLARYMKQ
ncbi:uncharacterized protein [Miscanthus floridulus]|uniref:uncharacterized protein isoform X1 n=1 Tax=Miscanthus floridulus TaxID=154761 RepID=UPI003459F89C